MTRKVYLHVGAPKTGTTYLQDRLARNAAALADHDVHYPTGSPLGDPSLFQFRAAVDLLGKEWAGPGEKAAGKWQQLARKARRRSGSVIISHELLASANREQIDRCKRDLGVGAGTELHVVYSARDLARQVPAAWQEAVKQGQTWSYRRFCRRITRQSGWFSRAVDVPTGHSAWSAGLPPEQVHVVTVPHVRGDELWRRFCRAFDIDPAWAPRESSRANPSLGAAETQLLRKLNRRLDRPNSIGQFDFLVRELVAERQLADRPMVPVRLPEELRGWAEHEAERWIEWLELSGVDVVGDLDDLRPRPAPEGAWVNPDRPGAKAQLNAALDALAALTLEAERRPDPDQTLARKVRRRLEERRS